jgi:hypothetical protein
MLSAPMRTKSTGLASLSSSVNTETGALSMRKVKLPSAAPGALERSQSNSKKCGPSAMGKNPVSAREPSFKRTRPSML